MIQHVHSTNSVQKLQFPRKPLEKTAAHNCLRQLQKIKTLLELEEKRTWAVPIRTPTVPASPVTVSRENGRLLHRGTP